MSVCPRGSSHTLLEGKGYMGLNTTQPCSFQAPLFTPSTIIVLRLCGTALFLSLTHPLTHKEGWCQQRLGGGGILCFLPSYACSDGLIRHMGPHATGTLPIRRPFVTTFSFLNLNTPLQNVGRVSHYNLGHVFCLKPR